MLHILRKERAIKFLKRWVCNILNRYLFLYPVLWVYALLSMTQKSFGVSFLLYAWKKSGENIFSLCSENGSVTHVNNPGICINAIYNKLYSCISLSTKCNNSKYTCTLLLIVTLEMTLKSRMLEPFNNKADKQCKSYWRIWIGNKRKRDDNLNEIPRFLEKGVRSCKM